MSENTNRDDKELLHQSNDFEIRNVIRGKLLSHHVRIKYNVSGVGLYIRLVESAHWRIGVLLKQGE